MPIRFQCPNPECGKTISVKDEFAGRTGKCPGCQASVKVPVAVAASAEHSPPPPRPAPPKPAPPPDVVEEVEDAEEAAEADPFGSLGAEPTPKKNLRARVEAVDAEEAVEDEPDDEPEGDADAVLNRPEWLIRNDRGLFSGNTVAGLFEDHESPEPIAVVRDARKKLFGLFPVDIPFVRNRPKLEIRLGKKTGPVVLTLEEFFPRFDIPIMPKKPTRWEVRNARGKVIGSVTLSRSGPNLIKMAKGQFFQDEHNLLDARGKKVGSLAIERAAMGRPSRIVVLDTDGEEMGAFGSQAGRTLKKMKEEGTKAKFSVSVLGKGDEEWQGIIGRINPARSGDVYSKAMIFAMTVLLEVIGFDRFAATQSRAKK